MHTHTHTNIRLTRSRHTNCSDETLLTTVFKLRALPYIQLNTCSSEHESNREALLFTYDMNLHRNVRKRERGREDKRKRGAPERTES